MIRIGIFGAGAMARTHIESIGAVRGARVSGVSWASGKSLEKIEKQYGVKAIPDVQELLAASDAISVCLPTGLHEGAVTRAAATGKHVLCEKPIALNVAAADHMIAACRKARVTFMVAHCLRFWPEYVYLKEAVAEKKHGRLLSLDMERLSSWPEWQSRGWLSDTQRSGGPTIDLHIHDADMALFVLGRPRAVRATEINTKTCRSIETEYFYKTKNLNVRARGGWIFPHGYPFHMSYRAVFENAVVEYDTRNAPALSVFGPGKKPSNPRLPKYSGYYYQMEHFVKCAAAGKQPKTSTGKHGRDALALVLAEQRSAKSQRTVNLKNSSKN